MKIASSAGANLIDMNKVQLHPTGFIDPQNPTAHTKYLGPEALRGSGGILVNQQGERFIDELNLRSVVSKGIMQNCGKYPLPDGSEGPPFAYCLLNAEAQKLFGPPQLRFYRDQQGLFEAAESVADVARIIGCEEATLQATLADYASACDQAYCLKTRKTVYPCKVKPEDTGFVVARVTPVIHYCMGGVQINGSGEAQQPASGSFSKKCTLPGLYAAGEVTGGVHGENRLGGNSLLDCVVFGRIAGQRAALSKQKAQDCLNSEEWRPVILREVRETGPSTAVYRFNLDGTMQSTGCPLGSYIAIRGNIDGDQLTGYYSPVSRPDDLGQIDILARTDAKGGPITAFLTQLKPGAEAEMKAMDGPQLTDDPLPGVWRYKGRQVRKISLLAGGTGLAPMIQLTRAYLRNLGDHEADPSTNGCRLLYAAEEHSELAFSSQLDQVAGARKDMFKQYHVLNKPPVGWTEGIGFVTPQIIKERLWYPPCDDHFILICGPPIFEKIMCSNLAKLGYPRDQYYSFAEG
jgi:NAD(P)H-flavin reductase